MSQDSADQIIREDVVVILDKHFHVGLGEKNTAAKTGDASGVSSPSKGDSLKNTGDALRNVWDEQSRRAAEIIRAAGYVFRHIHCVCTY